MTKTQRIAELESQIAAMKRKPTIPGFGAAKSSQYRKRMREERIAAAADFVGDHLDFICTDDPFFKRRMWEFVQESRTRYLRAVAAECWTPV